MDPSFEVIPIIDVASPLDPEEHRPVVLVVDDERTIADTLAIILSKNGFAAIAAYEGQGALEIARVIPPDLLLSDVAMPGMSGVDLAIAVTRRIADCKVLLFSGQSSTADLISKARVEGHNFQALTKPLHPEFLIACIRRFLETCEPIPDTAHTHIEVGDCAMFGPGI
jgi:DNA-binding response OmpR family regulator